MTGAITIKLARPIERRSAHTGAVVERIETIEMRAPTLGDLVAAMDASGGAKQLGTLTLHLAARLAGLPVRELEELDLADGAEVLGAVSVFMPAGLPTGTSSSGSSAASAASLPTGAAGGQPN